MAQVFIPSANDPAVFTTERFPLLKDANGNTYRTVVKANVNGSIDVYSKGTGTLGGDELLFQYSGTRNSADFGEGKFKDNPSAAFNSFFKEANSNGESFLKDVKIKWYSEAPPNSAGRMATLNGYKSIAATTPARQISNGPTSLTIQTGAGTTTLVSPAAAQNDPTQGSDPVEDQFDLFSDSNRALVPDEEGQRDNYNDTNGPWVYPTALRTNNQDYIKFNILQYEPRQFKLNNETGEILERRNTQKVPKGTICLPIQPSITDMNTVDWNGLGVNPLDLGLAQFSMQISEGQGNQGMENIMNYMTTQIKDVGVQNAAKLALAQKAAGTTGLLSRVTGAVVNPNLELLFQGPQLRPFNFTFKLSPRDSGEARVVKGIIRAFKEAMAVKVASSQLFLKAPNVFEIKYVRGKTREAEEIDPHPSLNKIKTCALQACNVDYTPDGTYMTFPDPAATMTSYSISLQFQELEPVTSKDYDKNYNEIGY